ncbi:MAG TPA: AAA family ATPase [Myxococcota bacterium]|nr:AAA family ATPase [Myxococcota bacterium]
MLLQLRVQGFKSLRDTTIRFGPLTCFVGHNGVGKSNIFDAIQFLKLLADHPIQDAAARVRKPLVGAHEPLDLFFDRDPRGTIRMEADLLVPRSVLDDFKREAAAAATLLRYVVSFRYQHDPVPRLELVEEELGYHKLGAAKELLGFPSAAEFRTSTLAATRRGEKFISTSATDTGGQLEIKLHQDGGSRGQPFAPGASPRTVLGGTNTIDYPTVLAARREMSSWRFLQLEPSAMRSPDADDGQRGISEHGGGIAATLHALAARPAADDAPDVLAQAVNDLRRLNEHVEALRVDRDRARNQLVLQARTAGIDGWLGPRALSDGTLRFLALVVLHLDPEAKGVIALEEPENGIHPTRVPALVDLLRSMAVDPRYPVDEDNPLRQVILNTHSPDVVRQLARDEVLWVDRVTGPDSARVSVRALAATWRAPGERLGADTTIPDGVVTSFIGGSMPRESWLESRLPLAFGTAV